MKKLLGIIVLSLVLSSYTNAGTNNEAKNKKYVYKYLEDLKIIEVNNIDDINHHREILKDVIDKQHDEQIQKIKLQIENEITWIQKGV